MGRAARALLAAWSAAVQAGRLDVQHAAVSDAAAAGGFNPVAPLLGGLLGAARRTAPGEGSSTALGAALLRERPGPDVRAPPKSALWNQFLGLDLVPGIPVFDGRYDWDLVPEKVADIGSTGVIMNARFTQKGAKDKDVVVKVLRTTGRRAKPKVDRERAMREVDIMNLFSGGPFLEYYGWWEEDDSILIVMERAEGNLFSTVINRPYFEIDVSTKVRLMSELMEGLEVMAKKGFVHRSIWPRNLLVVKDEYGDMHMKIGDFGSSCALAGGPANMVLTEEERRSITSSTYDAPEAYNQTYGGSTDVYAAGIIFYQMLFSGRYPQGFPPQEGDFLDRAFLTAWRRYDPSGDKVLNAAKAAAIDAGDKWLPQVLAVLERMLDPTPTARITAGEARDLLAALTRSPGRIQGIIRKIKDQHQELDG